MEEDLRHGTEGGKKELFIPEIVSCTFFVDGGKKCIKVTLTWFGEKFSSCILEDGKEEINFPVLRRWVRRRKKRETISESLGRRIFFPDPPTSKPRENIFADFSVFSPRNNL